MGKTKPQMKSWLTLTVDELEKIISSGEVPADLDWNTLAEHSQFSKLFRLRDNPSKLAEALLREKAPERVKPSKPQRVEYKSSIPIEMRQERLNLRREELDLARARVKNATIQFEKICQIETDVKTLKKMQKITLDFLRSLDARLRELSQPR